MRTWTVESRRTCYAARQFIPEFYSLLGQERTISANARLKKLATVHAQPLEEGEAVQGHE